LASQPLAFFADDSITHGKLSGQPDYKVTVPKE
jgi:hypothetical protein